jgi:hypothetical protein
MLMNSSDREMRDGLPYTWYNWLDPSSLDESLCSKVFMKDEARKNSIAYPELYGC